MRTSLHKIFKKLAMVAILQLLKSTGMKYFATGLESPMGLGMQMNEGSASQDRAVYGQVATYARISKQSEVREGHGAA